MGQQRILTTHCEQPIGTKISDAYSCWSANIFQFISSQNMTLLYFLLVQHWKCHLTFSCTLYIILLLSKLHAGYFFTKCLVTLFYNTHFAKELKWTAFNGLYFSEVFISCTLWHITYNSAPVPHTRTVVKRPMSTNSPWQAILVLSCTEGHDKKAITCCLTMKYDTQLYALQLYPYKLYSPNNL